MRPDLAKVTTESPRFGHSTCPSKKHGGKVRIEDKDSTYDREHSNLRSSARHRQGGPGRDYKSFSDVLGPLKGVLRANVGRPWDKVYSEFCKSLDKRSNAGIHIIGHMNDFVEQNCFLEDSKVWRHSNYYGKIEVDGFYVHPKSKLLCFKERVRYNRGYNKDKPITELKIGQVTFMTEQNIEDNTIWVKGIWKDIPYTHNGFKKNLKTGLYDVPYTTVTYTRVFTNKQTANKAELKMINDYLGQQEKIKRRKAA